MTAVLGHSYGGGIAWLMALQAPDRVERLVLMVQTLIFCSLPFLNSFLLFAGELGIGRGGMVIGELSSFHTRVQQHHALVFAAVHAARQPARRLFQPRSRDPRHCAALPRALPGVRFTYVVFRAMIDVYLFIFFIDSLGNRGPTVQLLASEDGSNPEQLKQITVPTLIMVNKSTILLSLLLSN